jgi:hypothetical protein
VRLDEPSKVKERRGKPTRTGTSGPLASAGDELKRENAADILRFPLSPGAEPCDSHAMSDIHVLEHCLELVNDISSWLGT